MQERESGTMQGRKHRGRSEIMSSVLRFLKNEGPQSKTRIMGYCGVSFWQTKDYFPAMLNAGLIALDEARHFEITDKGLEFLTSMEHVQELYSEVKA